MERRDYLMDQIRELGIFIARLLGRLKSATKADEGQLLNSARNELTVQFGWDLDELLFLDDAAFLSLMEESLLTDEHYEQMADLFEQMGDLDNRHQTLLRKELYYQKAWLLLRYADRRSSTYSMIRRNHMVDLEQKMAF